MRVEIAKGKESLPFHWPFFLSVDSNPRDSSKQAGKLLEIFWSCDGASRAWICATYALCSILRRSRSKCAQQPGISVSIVVERIPHSEKQLPLEKREITVKIPFYFVDVFAEQPL